jgi:hypothetical protein
VGVVKRLLLAAAGWCVAALVWWAFAEPAWRAYGEGYAEGHADGEKVGRRRGFNDAIDSQGGA